MESQRSCKYNLEIQRGYEKKKRRLYIMVERIMEMTSENLNIDRALIQPTSSFKGDLGIDSLDLFELVMALEEEFDVEIPTEDLEKLSTVQDVADYVEAHRA